MVRSTFSLFFAITLSGCSSLGYLLQAGKGQLQLSNRARPISEVLKDERTPPRIKTLLSEIPEIKKFGESHGLKPTSNYVDYADLKRPAAVWVVSACPPLEFKPLEWSFPIVGGFTYLGWFDLNGAKKQYEELKHQGFDADLRPARAFSTLGWFRDPVLSTMISDDDTAWGELINVVIHESVHATLYIKHQSYFNESVASFVADRLTPIYFTEHKPKNMDWLESWQRSEAEGEKRAKLLHATYQELESLYRSNQTQEKKLEEKAKLLAKLKETIGAKRDINNATLIQYRTYSSGKEDFESLFKACNQDWKRFLDVMLTLRPESFKEPHQQELGSVLTSLTAKCR